MKNAIVLKFLLPLLLAHTIGYGQETKQIKGMITDENNIPLPGVNIVVKGTTSGTQSDFDGLYIIEAAESQVLVFSYLGQKTVEKTVDMSTTINVQMSEDAAQLEEVVVVGYGTQSKRLVTDNIAKIASEQIGGISTPSLQSALVAKAPGVQITQINGKLEGSVKVIIRGLSSVSASQEPLYVIDGIEMNNTNISSITAQTNPLLALNPNDIESIDILKDASAAAIYGAKGTNGVILITTKRGKEGKSNISLDLASSIGMPSHKREWLNASQYIELLKESALNSGSFTDEVESNEWVDTRLKRYEGDQDYTTIDTDWQEEAFQNSYVQDANLSISGGNEKTKSFISGSYNGTDGIVRGNNLERISLRTNIDHRVTDWLNVGLNMGYTSTVIDRIAGDNSFTTPMQAIAQVPTSPVYLLDGELNGNTLYTNFLLQDKYSSRKTKRRRLLGKFFASVAISDELRFQSEIGYDYLNQTVDRSTGRLAPFQSTNGQTFASDDGTEIISTNNYITFDKTLNASSNIDFVLGTTYTRFKNRSISVTGDGFPTDDFKSISSAATISAGSGDFSNWAQLSYFARFTYDYKSKYILKASIRQDGSSRFGSENRFGYFPAASAGWIVSEEEFLQGSNTLSNLKLRISWGINGNTPTGNFSSLGLYGGTNYNGESGLEFTQGENPDLKWEETEQINFGLDLGFLNNRITGEIDYYKKKTKDLLFNTRVPFEALIPSHRVLQNIGNLENSGFEFSLNTINVQTDHLLWKTNFNIAVNKNEITNLPDGEDQITDKNILREGKAINSFYLVEYAGVNPDTGDAEFILNTENADGSLDKGRTNDFSLAQRIVTGNPNPDIIAGLSSTLNYQKIDFSFTFQGQWGAQLYNEAGQYQETGFGNGLDNQDVYVYNNRWRNPGDITDVPQARLFTDNGNSHSTRYLQDADFIRLRNITIAYSLPSRTLERVGMSGIRIYMSGLNLLTFTDYRGYDPESSFDDFNNPNINAGSTFYSAPPAKVYTIGVNLTF